MALTKIFIDSLNEKELIKGIDKLEKENPKGIDKLEAFLKSQNMAIPDMITFFRNIQALRSSTVAHRRNVKRKDTKKVLDYFEFGDKPINTILEDIFGNFIRTIKSFDEYILMKKNT